ncbi:cytochrome-c oxidase [Saccharococcus thermophilus]|uniref:Cbb3-type cytochrome oxidase subunit 1 n=1 Tax=Saccharococcus thermophilus TaxID=29396 RepID=A0A846M8J4_9BACL|nr:cytochrome-c oxidase [Saccharococcus thermophilus]NIK13806.1 cbb3-type cytochrome oxidase subunit 1 [Saccharococcus thermophilus]
MGIRLIKISAVYFTIGVCLGLYMSISHSFTLTPVHVHINLLGWTALTLAGIIYHLFPQAAATKLAKTHFWLHNIGLPLMMIGLIFVVYRHNAWIPVTALGGTLVVIAVIVFAVNVLQNVKQS